VADNLGRKARGKKEKALDVENILKNFNFAGNIYISFLKHL
jgi:hypothetical protein